jgi:hypothetical protein
MKDFVGFMLTIAENGRYDTRVEAKHLSDSWRSEVKEMLTNAAHFFLKHRDTVLE